MPRIRFTIILIFFLAFKSALASFILIPMDDVAQENHLKAYGVTFLSLKKGHKVQWLLNYRGGSFLLEDVKEFRDACTIRGVSYEVISNQKATAILQAIKSPSQNMDAVLLEKAPKIAVYSPKEKKPWDDAVTMVLTYAEIPYDIVYDEDILNDALLKYEWLHLHHEDFTGQFGKFYGAFRTAPWYIENKVNAEKLAQDLGYEKVSQEKQ